VMVERYG